MRMEGLKILRLLIGFIPGNVLEFTYTSLLKPRPLRFLVNTVLLFFIPDSINVGEVDLFLNKKDPVVSGSLALGVYERPETQLFLGLLKPASVKEAAVFIDVGANIGYYTALAARKVKKIIAIEPDPRSFALLSKTVKENDLQNVTLYALALSDKNSEGLLYLSNANYGNNRLYPHFEAQEAIPITLTRLDDLVKEDTASLIIKMDTQGAEGKVLAGMMRTLRSTPHVQILTEFFPQGMRHAGSNPEEFLSILSELGFKMWNINKRTGNLERVAELAEFAKSLVGREFANLYCDK